MTETPNLHRVHDALESEFDEYCIRHTISSSADAIRLTVDVGHIETESMIEADFHQERFVTDETYDVLYQAGEGLTETIPWENR